MAPLRLTDKHRLLVELLRAAGGEAPRVSFMKWLFLLVRETDWGAEQSPYDFVPYRFGPFSFLAAHDLRRLGDAGVVAEPNEASVRIVSRDVAGLTQARGAIDEVMARYGRYSAESLMRHVYQHYPWYAMLSERRDLASTAPDRRLAKPRVYTIGYAGRNIDEFLSALLEADLAGVVDVRDSPSSRAYGFSRRQLEKHLGRLSLQYIARPELGVPSTDRGDIGSREKRQALLRRYEGGLRASGMGLVSEVAGAMADEPLALMCMESAPEDCHRSALARVIAEGTGLPVKHL